jgi:hypothetical protein
MSGRWPEMTIWKFPLPDIIDTQEVEMPRGAMILTIQLQDGVPTMWAIVNAQSAPVKIPVHIRGTGQPLDLPPPPMAVWIGTIQMGPLVWHYFMEQPKQSVILAMPERG